MHFYRLTKADIISDGRPGFEMPERYCFDLEPLAFLDWRMSGGRHWLSFHEYYPCNISDAVLAVYAT